MVQCMLKEDTLTVKLNGDLDQHAAERAREVIDAFLMGHPRIQNLVFDMRQVTFMDSSGIGMVIGRYKLMQRRGGCTLVRNCAPRVDRIFHMAGLYRIIGEAGEERA